MDRQKQPAARQCRPGGGLQTSAQARIWELDAIRGVCVVLMILDHVLYDLGFLFGPAWAAAAPESMIAAVCTFVSDIYWLHPLRLIVRSFVLAGFIGICGICCSFSRSNLRRGLKLLAVALLLTLVTAAMDAFSGYTDFYIIRFGVLHMLAISILLYALLQRLPWPLLVLFGLLLIAVGKYYSTQPVAWSGLLPFVLGIGDGSYSADYFPLLPYSGYFLLGAALGVFPYRKKQSRFPHGGSGAAWRPFCFLGRHALWAYLLHQPLVYGLLLLLGLLFGL